MKALSAFRSRIAPFFLGCLNEIIDQEVLDTCIDFSERTLIVKLTADPFTTVVGRREYDLDEGVTRVMRVWCDGRELHPKDEDSVGAFGFVSNIAGETRTGTPVAFVQTEPGVIALIPTPDKAHTIHMRVAVKPTRSSTQIEDVLFNDHCPAIVDGAMARLAAQPADWGNKLLFIQKSGSYEAAVSLAKLEASRGVTRAELRVRPVHV